MRLRSVIFLALLASTAAAADEPLSPSVSKNLVTLGIGQQLVISDVDLAQISIGNPRIAQARLTPDRRQILITAQAAGSTDLVIWKQNGEKSVRPLWVIGGSVKEHALELGSLLSSIENVRVRQVGERIVIEGEALRQNDLNRISQLAALYPNVTNLVAMAETIKPILVETLNRKLHDIGYPELAVEALGNQVFLHGEFSTAADHDKALTIARAVYADIVDVTRIGSENQPLIRLDLTLVELNRSHLRQFGIRWQEVLEATGKLQIGTPESNLALTSDFTAAIQILEKKGWGRILTQPSLLCRSGEAAKFLAGGEIPIRLVSERTADITFKPYGILLHFVPRRTASGAISLVIETEISSIDGGNSIEGLPAFLSRQLTSTVTLASGKHLVLGGLTDRNDWKAIERVPFLADLPVLGELFKSRQFRDGGTDLVIFITPRLLPADLADELPSVTAHKQRYEEARSWFQIQPND